MREMIPQDPDRLEAFLQQLGRRAGLKKEPAGMTRSVMSRVFSSAPPLRHFQWGALSGAAAALLVGWVLGASWVKSRQEIPVRFALSASRAQSVSLAGDFTGWRAVPLRRDNGHWVVDLRVPKGRYQYAFILNDRLIVIDPNAAHQETDDRGRVYSVLDTRNVTI